MSLENKKAVNLPLWKTSIWELDRKISVVLITQNEEIRTANAIRSCLSFASEIIVVDGGSTDSTVERSQELDCKVFVNPWCGYVKQRQFGIDQAQHEWIFMIDSDEVISEELADSILEWRKTSELVCQAFSVNRVGNFLGVWLTNNSDDQLRLFNKRQFRIKDMLVHESLDIGQERVAKLNGVLWHAGFRSIHDHVARFNHYTTLDAQQNYLDGKRFNLLRLLLKPIARFLQYLLLHRLFQKGIPGLSVSAFKAYYDFIKELKLYEIAWKEEVE